MWCITTLITSDNYYKQYVPLFEYTIKKAIPDADVKVFILEELFPGYPKSSVNALRFHIPAEHFKGYKYVYFTDIDFIFLPHKFSLLKYHARIMKNTGQPYSGHRGPVKGRWRKSPRMAAGAFMVGSDWFKKTAAARRSWKRRLKKGMKYREHDEVMLYDICKKSGMRVPRWKGRFINNKHYDIKYRDIHLGDFKFSRRFTNFSRMRSKFMTLRNLKNYKKLFMNDPEWQKILETAREDRHMAKIIKNFNWYVKHCTG